MINKFKSYEEAAEWLFYELPRTSKGIFKGEAGLENMRRILGEFDNPQDDYLTVHIAGTSGKGTTAKLITDMLVLSGKIVGTIMSPHVYDLRERFLVNGNIVNKSEVVKALSQLRVKSLELNAHDIYPSYFEATLLLAYLVFRNHRLDYLVVETGFGGLLDGTNLISRQDKVAVITQIGLDHTEILGDSLEEITNQKAGIITSNIEAIALDQIPEVNSVISEAAEAKQATLHFVKPAQQAKNNPRLSGKHQASNIALAKKASEVLAQRDGWKIADNIFEKAMDSFSLPGRFEFKQLNDKEIILDGAHNTQKLEALVSTVKQLYPGQKFCVVFGSARNRHWLEFLEILRPITHEFIFTTYSARKSDIKRAAQDFTGTTVEGVKTTVINDPAAVVKYMSESKSSAWLVTGSFYVVSEIGQLLP